VWKIPTFDLSNCTITSPLPRTGLNVLSQIFHLKNLTDAF
jgi:hypothetical protein